MKKHFLLNILLFLASLAQFLQAQEFPTDIFIIDSYITPEQPHKIKISFITSDSVKSKIIINETQVFSVSKDFVGTHKFEKDLKDIKVDSLRITYRIEIEDTLGNVFSGELNELELPTNLATDNKDTGWLNLCIGASIFSLPNPTLIISDGKKYFSFTKEIPLISFFTKGYNYPIGYFSVEYAYTNKFTDNHFFRTGYKQVFQVPYIEFISLGFNGFTNFNGKNGLSPELTIGLIKFYNVFTLFTRYRFNIKPNEANYKFHEITVGLYSNILSINF